MHWHEVAFKGGLSSTTHVCSDRYARLVKVILRGQYKRIVTGVLEAVGDCYKLAVVESDVLFGRSTFCAC